MAPFQRTPVLFDATIRLLLTASLASVQIPKEVIPIVVPGFPHVVGEVFLRATANDGALLRAPDGVTFPFSLQSSYLFVDTIDEVIERIGPPVLWRCAENADDLHFALTAEVVEAVKARGVSPEAAKSFTLGSEFFDSARHYGATGWDGAHCDLLRETCARIVISDPKNSIGNLTRPDGSGRMQPIKRQRDGAIACRTHLQKRHEASRLMFWRLTDGSIEFANVGPKNELEITEGSAESTGKSDCWDC